MLVAGVTRGSWPADVNPAYPPNPHWQKLINHQIHIMKAMKKSESTIPCPTFTQGKSKSARSFVCFKMATYDVLVGSVVYSPYGGRGFVFRAEGLVSYTASKVLVFCVYAIDILRDGLSSRIWHVSVLAIVRGGRSIWSVTLPVFRPIQIKTIFVSLAPTVFVHIISLAPSSVVCKKDASHEESEDDHDSGRNAENFGSR